MGKVGVRDVARHAGVSLGTVSNVINRPDVVSESSRERVLASMRHLGYSWPARSTCRHKSMLSSLALIVPDIANPFFSELTRGMEFVCNRLGYKLMLCDTNSSAESEKAYLEFLEHLGVTGICIVPASVPSPSLNVLERLTKRGMPTVLVDYRDANLNLCSVTVNDELGGQMAMQHLTQLGHRRVLWVTGPHSIPQTASRERGIWQELQRHGNSVGLRRLEVPHLDASGGPLVTDFLAGLAPDQRPTAIICANDLLAIAVCEMLQHVDVKVPEDMAIVGFDDIAFAAFSRIPITSVQLPARRMGVRAAEVLADLIANQRPTLSEHTVFEPTLVVRDSTQGTLLSA